MFINILKSLVFKKRRIAVLAVFVLLAALAILGIYSTSDTTNTDPAMVPIIRADAGTFKDIPSDPGGMEIPHRDSTVFETLRTARSEDGIAPIENLLPGPEEPLSRSELFAGLKTEIETETADTTSIAATTENPVKTPAETTIAAMVPETQVETPQPVAPAPRPSEKPDNSVTATVASQDIASAEIDKAIATEPAAGKADDYFVQLGSFRSEPDAKSGWGSFQKRFPDQLNDLALRVQKAELGERGTYYRVQAGPIEEAKARSICQQVEQKQPGGCLVIQR